MKIVHKVKVVSKRNSLLATQEDGLRKPRFSKLHQLEMDYSKQNAIDIWAVTYIAIRKIIIFIQSPSQ